jgi:hypothetical protein
MSSTLKGNFRNSFFPAFRFSMAIGNSFAQRQYVTYHTLGYGCYQISGKYYKTNEAYKEMKNIHNEQILLNNSAKKGTPYVNGWSESTKVKHSRFRVPLSTKRIGTFAMSKRNEISHFAFFFFCLEASQYRLSCLIFHCLSSSFIRHKEDHNVFLFSSSSLLNVNKLSTSFLSFIRLFSFMTKTIQMGKLWVNTTKTNVLFKKPMHCIIREKKSALDASQVKLQARAQGGK